MVAHGLQSMQHVVESESGHTQRTVRLVASWICQLTSPKVILQKITPWGLWSKVFVPLYARLIIIDKTTVHCVQIEYDPHSC